jgi:hypothetical protein
MMFPDVLWLTFKESHRPIDIMYFSLLVIDGFAILLSFLRDNCMVFLLGH